MSWFNKKRALVLGCGPAGLFAAHALLQEGYSVEIRSKKRRSEMFGAQYLHREIPGLKADHTVVDYQLRGDIDGYRRKVYGDAEVVVSPESLIGQHEAWDIRAAYWDAWDRYQDLITPYALTPASLMDLRLHDFKLVISSVPAPVLCHELDVHRFVAQSIWAIGDAPERGVFCPIPSPPNTVICDGTDTSGYYRISNVFGYKTAEWPDARKPPLDNIAEVHKPIRNNCNCWPDIKRVGRYGAWRKGVLSHHAYEAAKEWS
jgi:hypothetical protein